MHNIILFGDDHWFDLLPLTFTRPIAGIRIGILTIKEKWEHHMDAKVSYITQDYLSEQFPIHIEDHNLIINSTFLPTPSLVDKVKNLKLNQALIIGEEMVAAYVTRLQLEMLNEDPDTFDTLETTELTADEILQTTRITRPTHIFQKNDGQIKADFELITRGRISQPISETNKVIGNNPVFLEEGVKMECCILNTEKGPIYIGHNTLVMEGCLMRGPISIGDHNVIKMGAKIYGPTTFGPGCKMGGEINNSVVFENSNKSHEGYLGNSVIGAWCNLGADTNTSNLKNNYSEIKLWSYRHKKFEATGTQFCGLIMGDHTKAGINTMFNTGTVVGVACNIFGDGYPRNFIPSFSWGGASGFTDHQLAKVIETEKLVMARRDTVLSDEYERLLSHIYYNMKD
jgi:UDP-N-acetylglucosamine diphosphorylase/glucosamine-1-phosphate N-acetyltransferase